jgi:hypothetical protein
VGREGNTAFKRRHRNFHGILKGLACWYEAYRGPVCQVILWEGKEMQLSSVDHGSINSRAGPRFLYILYVPVGVVETASAAHYLLEIKGNIHGEKQISLFLKKRRRKNHGQKS